MWGKVYQAANITKGPLIGATVQVWKDGSNYKIIVLDDPTYNGDYYKTTILNQSGTPFELVKFDAIGGAYFFYKPGSEDGIIILSSGNIDVMED